MVMTLRDLNHARAGICGKESDEDLRYTGRMSQESFKKDIAKSWDWPDIPAF